MSVTSQSSVDPVRLLETWAGKASSAADRRLNEAEVYALLAAGGIVSAPHAVLPAGADRDRRQEWAGRARDLAEQHGGVVLKILGRDLLHKSDLGGVRVLDAGDSLSEPAILQAADDLLETVGRRTTQACEGVLATAFIPHRANTPGQELLLSIRRDPAFGPVVVVGVGGLLTEWYGSASAGASRIILPATDLDAATVRAVLESHPLLRIFCQPSRLYREPPVTAETLAGTIVALARLAVRLDAAAAWRLDELEINPAVVHRGEVVAIDGVGRIVRRGETAPARPLATIDRLLHPRSAAIVGVSARGANPGRIILDNLLSGSDIPRERLWVVHPTEREIAGVPCVPSFAALPQPVDLAVISIPAEAARDAIAELVDGGHCRAIILIPGGFSEVGAGDLAREIEEKLAEGHRRPGGGPVLVGGNSLGIVSRDHYNTFFIPRRKLPFNDAPAGGNLALVSQSGAYLVTYASNYDGLILPRASISFGNQMDLTAADFLEYFTDQAGIAVIACYLEGFRDDDGVRFLSAAQRARSRGKLVIVYKAGRTPAGAKAAASHTASLAGDYAVARACLESAGVLVTESLSEFEDLITLATLLAERRVRGRRVGIISNAGFECTSVTDAVAGLEPVPFDEATRAVLDEVMPPIAHRDNPVDATPMAGTEAYARSIEAVCASSVVDTVIVSAVPVTPALDDPDGGDRPVPMDGFAAACRDLLGRTDKPAIVVLDSGAMYDDLARAIARGGIPVFRKIDRAGRALSRYIAARLAAADRE